MYKDTQTEDKHSLIKQTFVLQGDRTRDIRDQWIWREKNTTIDFLILTHKIDAVIDSTSTYVSVKLIQPRNKTFEKKCPAKNISHPFAYK